MKKLRHLAEYVLLCPLLLLLTRLPLAYARKLTLALSDSLYFVDFRRRSVALDNILRSGICSDRRRASRIARASYGSFALVILESLRSDEILNGDHAATIDVKIDAELQDLLNDPAQGMILATGHFGSWEMAAQLLSRTKPVAGVTRGMNNPYVENLVKKRKPRHRFHLVPKYDPGNVGRFPEILKNGEVLALMIDQHARARGMNVEFFGRPAATHTAIALLHLVTRAPLCFGYCRRTGESSYEVRATGPYRFEPTGDKKADIRNVIRALNAELEKAVRADPEQYLWGHRRWRED